MQSHRIGGADNQTDNPRTGANLDNLHSTTGRRSITGSHTANPAARETSEAFPNRESPRKRSRSNVSGGFDGPPPCFATGGRVRRRDVGTALALIGLAVDVARLAIEAAQALEMRRKLNRARHKRTR